MRASWKVKPCYCASWLGCWFPPSRRDQRDSKGARVRGARLHARKLFARHDALRRARPVCLIAARCEARQPVYQAEQRDAMYISCLKMMGGVGRHCSPLHGCRGDSEPISIESYNF